jgi:hypothetical protein
MGKLSSALLGAAIGAVVSATLYYLFGPAGDTSFDQRYQSRIDYALAEGKRAETEREAELRRQLTQMRKNQLPPLA